MNRILSLLSLITISIWIAVFNTDSRLHIVACDVGQGDAILIQKGTAQILIDGGPNKSVLNCLGKHMPFWDRQIELVILTHPQEDHYGGLVDVIKTYKVLQLGQFNTESGSQGYQVIQNTPINRITLTRGVKLRLGMIYLDILHPADEQLPINNLQFSSNTNDNGVVVLLKYAQFKALLTADVENKVSDELSRLPEIQNINYLKVNHHGSKNGMSQKLLDATNPDVAVISVAKKNSYGHPHEEIIKMLNDKQSLPLRGKKINIRRTDLEGDVDYVME